MPSPRTTRYTAIVVLLILGFTAGVGTTLYSQQVSAPATLQQAIQKLNPQPKGAEFNQLVQVWDRLHAQFVNTNIDDQKLLQGALSGMVGGLGDPYSTYFTAAQSKDFQNELSGTFDGVGMQVGYKNEKVTIIAPLPNSPAEKSGLKAGDFLLTVDKKDVSTMSLDEVITAIRGTRGTSVTLTIQRGTDPQPKTYVITRETISVDSVTTKSVEWNGKKLAVVAINSFNRDTGREFRAKVKTLNAQSFNGFILDLRNNPGGYLDQAVDVASAFIPNGLIVSEVDRNGQRQAFNAEGNAFLDALPVAVLVDGGSASASEIVAGALQDDGHGTVIGTQTFGKGTVQDYITLNDGSSLKLTIAKWLTPKGRSISEHGITPDIVVEASTDPAVTTDVQLERAENQLAPKP